MKLNEYLKELRSKYKEVSTLRELASKKGNVLYQLSYKNKREQRIVIVVNKKKEIMTKNKIKKDVDIKKLGIDFKRNFENYVAVKINEDLKRLEQSQSRGVRDIKIIDKINKKIDAKIEQKKRKLKSDFKYKNDYEKRDVRYFYFIFRFLTLHLFENNIVEKKDDEIKLKKGNDSKEDKELLTIFKEIAYVLNHTGIKDNSLKKDLLDKDIEKTIKKMLSTNIQDEFFYILIAMDMLVNYKYLVKFKNLNIMTKQNGFRSGIDWKFAEDYLNFLEDMYFEADEKTADNSNKASVFLLKEIYDIKLSTKLESRKILKKIKQKGA